MVIIARENIKRRVKKPKKKKMVVKKTLSDLKGGVELNKPEISVQYVLAATFGIVVLVFAWRMGTLILAKGGEFAQGRIPGVETTDFKAALGIV